MKATIRLVFGTSYLNESGTQVYGDGLTRKDVHSIEAATIAELLLEANSTFGVKFAKSCRNDIYTAKLTPNCKLVLIIKE